MNDAFSMMTEDLEQEDKEVANEQKKDDHSFLQNKETTEEKQEKRQGPTLLNKFEQEYVDKDEEEDQAKPKIQMAQVDFTKFTEEEEVRHRQMLVQKNLAAASEAHKK
jgi:hypothetical protein